jgi:hypothetical protein
MGDRKPRQENRPPEKPQESGLRGRGKGQASGECWTAGAVAIDAYQLIDTNEIQDRAHGRLPGGANGKGTFQPLEDISWDAMWGIVWGMNFEAKIKGSAF